MEIKTHSLVTLEKYWSESGKATILQVNREIICRAPFTFPYRRFSIQDYRLSIIHIPYYILIVF